MSKGLQIGHYVLLMMLKLFSYEEIEHLLGVNIQDFQKYDPRQMLHPLSISMHFNRRDNVVWIK